MLVSARGIRAGAIRSEMRASHPLDAVSEHVVARVCLDFIREALTELQLKRYCCRRMVLTHVDLIEKLLHYNSESICLRLLLCSAEAQRDGDARG